MKHKLSKAQEEVIDKLKEGWQLGHNNTFDGRWWLQKGKLGCGGEIVDVSANTAYALLGHGLIALKRSGFPTSLYELLQKRSRTRKIEGKKQWR